MKNLPRLSILFLLASSALYTCKKENIGNQVSNNNNGPTTVGNTPETITKGTDPQVAAAQGFFLTDSWQSKTFTVPSNAATASKPAASDITVTIDLSQIITKVSPYIFGNNTNPFMGQFVDQPVLMSNLTTLSPNILRFPGGSLSDIYFWNAGNGQAPAD
ncbi:MAG TPA: hypothetical protein VHB54_16390, partial [Mucilaginibacter sp.]|nr:hypothetical protein [Mucilaginibacter sp.]